MIADGLIVDYTVNTAPPDYTVNTAPVACKDVVRKVVFGSTLLKSRSTVSGTSKPSESPRSARD